MMAFQMCRKGPDGQLRKKKSFTVQKRLFQEKNSYKKHGGSNVLWLPRWEFELMGTTTISDQGASE